MKIKKQAGLTTLGLIFVIGTFGFLIVTSFKVVPIYTEFFQIKTAVKALSEDRGINVKSKRDVWTAISKRLRVNNIRTRTDKDFIITRENKITSVQIKYEVRIPYVANMFIGANFDESIEINR